MRDRMRLASKLYFKNGDVRELWARARTAQTLMANNARCALAVCLNFEEGGETVLLMRHEHAETFLVEILVRKPCQKMTYWKHRESLYEYGSRSGVFGAYSNEFGRPEVYTLTWFRHCDRMERNPDVAKAYWARQNMTSSVTGLKMDSLTRTCPRSTNRTHDQSPLALIESAGVKQPVVTGSDSPTRGAWSRNTQLKITIQTLMATDITYWVKVPNHKDASQTNRTSSCVQTLDCKWQWSFLAIWL